LYVSASALAPALRPAASLRSACFRLGGAQADEEEEEEEEEVADRAGVTEELEGGYVRAAVGRCDEKVTVRPDDWEDASRFGVDKMEPEKAKDKNVWSRTIETAKGQAYGFGGREREAECFDPWLDALQPLPANPKRKRRKRWAARRCQRSTHHRSTQWRWAERRRQRRRRRMV
jgi:hypothetical protein